jgi:uncharacterized pyridoxamine 5'-phosphate oxidase family protein
MDHLKYAEIWNYFEGLPLTHIMTRYSDQENERVMTLIAYDNKLWLASKSNGDGWEQIEENGPIELTVWGAKGTGCARAVGYTRPVEDFDTKIRLSKTIPWFDSYWSSPTDSEFTLLQLELDLVTVDNPNNGGTFTVAIP